MTRAATLLGCFLVATGVGCKGTQKSNGGQSRDPLYGRYIPKTDLPIPDRRDPLLTAPTSNPKSRASNLDPYRSTKETSVAGLAANVRVEESGLSLGDRRTTAEPARGTPLRKGAMSESWDTEADELNRLKARYDAPTRDANGEYVMMATVSRGADGATKRYEASGVSAAAAAKQLVEAIRSDE